MSTAREEADRVMSTFQHVFAHASTRTSMRDAIEAALTAKYRRGVEDAALVADEMWTRPSKLVAAIRALAGKEGT